MHISIARENIFCIYFWIVYSPKTHHLRIFLFWSCKIEYFCIHKIGRMLPAKGLLTTTDWNESAYCIISRYHLFVKCPIFIRQTVNWDTASICIEQNSWPRFLTHIYACEVCFVAHVSWNSLHVLLHGSLLSNNGVSIYAQSHYIRLSGRVSATILINTIKSKVLV